MDVDNVHKQGQFRDGEEDFVIRALLKKHEDHVRVLEALIYNQETLISVKDAKIDELQDSKLQVEHLLAKLQDSQLFLDEQNGEWEQERIDYSKEIDFLNDINTNLKHELDTQIAKTEKLQRKVEQLKETISSSKDGVETVNAVTQTSEQSPVDANRNELFASKELCGRLEELQAEKQHLRHQLENTRSANDELRQLVADLEGELENSKQLQDELQQQVESLREELRQLKDEKDMVISQQVDTMHQAYRLKQSLPESIQRIINIKVCLRQHRHQSKQQQRQQHLVKKTGVEPLHTLDVDDAAVFGVTVLNNELFAVRWKNPGVIEVYDMVSEFCPLRLIAIHLQPASADRKRAGLLRGLMSYLVQSKRPADAAEVLDLPSARLTDIASCRLNSNIYVSDLTHCQILRLDPVDAGLVASWTVDGGAYGLSVTTRGTLLVCCTGSLEIREFTADGDPISRTPGGPEAVCLQPDCLQPWQAVERCGGSIVVCHGGRYWNDDVGRLVDDPLHRVCAVDDLGDVTASHGSGPGSAVDRVCYPLYLAVVGRRHILVADCDNDRVKLLDDRLDCVGVVLGPDHGLRGPYRLAVCPDIGHLVVGLVDGRIVIYRLKDVLPATIDVDSSVGDDDDEQRGRAADEAAS